MKRILAIVVPMLLVGTVCFAGTSHTTSDLDLAGTLTLADDEVMSNASDVVTVAGDDNDTGFAVKGFEAKDGYVLLQADESDDNGDDWKIEADQATNSLILSNDTSGSQAAKMTLTTAGAVTFPSNATITSGYVTATNTTYCVKASSSATSSVSTYFCGAFATLPTTGISEGAIAYQTSDHALYISTEAVVGAQSWKAVW